MDPHYSAHEKGSATRLYVFGFLTIASAGSFVYGLVKNSQGSVELYDKLIATDAAGGDVELALNQLREYIYSHMNSEVGGPNGIYPPIQLKGTYERLVASEAARVEDANSTLYTEAQQYCEANGNQGFSGRNRLDCIDSYIDQNGVKPQEIQDSLYKFNFVAPQWSPDLAGFSMISMILFAVITLILTASHVRTKHLLHMSK